MAGVADRTAGAEQSRNTIAFSPVAEIESGRLYAHEAALVGIDGGPAHRGFARGDTAALIDFDCRYRVAAVRRAAKAGFAQSGTRLVLDLLAPEAMRPTEALAPMLAAARACNISPARLILRIARPELLSSLLLADWMDVTRKSGPMLSYGPFRDDEEQIQRLSRCPPDMVFLAREEIENVASSWGRRIRLDNFTRRISSIRVKMIAPGVENEEEAARLRAVGVRYVSGPLIGAPEIGTLPASEFASRPVGAAEMPLRVAV